MPERSLAKLVTRHMWASQIRQACQNTVESILKIGTTLMSAKDSLKHSEFLAMIREDLPFGPRTSQMFMKLARDDRLRTSGSHLPPSWRTLVEISRLDDEAFQAGIKTGAINPGITREDAWKLRFPQSEQTQAPQVKPTDQTVQLPAVVEPTHPAATDDNQKARFFRIVDVAHERVRQAFYTGDKAYVKSMVEQYTAAVQLAINSAMLDSVEGGIAALQAGQAKINEQNSKVRKNLREMHTRLDKIDKRV